MPLTMYANNSAAAGTSTASQWLERMQPSMRAAHAVRPTPGPAYTDTRRQRDTAVPVVKVRWRAVIHEKQLCLPQGNRLRAAQSSCRFSSHPVTKSNLVPVVYVYVSCS
jgi:hypothetical protein